LYMYKLFFSFMAILVVSEILAVLSNTILQHDWRLVVLSALCSSFVALSLTGINLGAGSFFANYREKNPIRVASSQGASLTFLVSMVYLALVVGILVVPLNDYFEHLIIQGRPTTGWIYLPVALVALMSFALFALSTGIGLRSIRRDF